MFRMSEFSRSQQSLCFSVLSIHPVLESASQLENQITDVEQVYRVLQDDACNEVSCQKISCDAGLSKAKEKLSEGMGSFFRLFSKSV